MLYAFKLFHFLLILNNFHHLQGDKVLKSVFIIFFQGDQLKTRVKKICEGFRATLYPCPETPTDRREMAMGVMTRIEDLNTVCTSEFEWNKSNFVLSYLEYETVYGRIL